MRKLIRYLTHKHDYVKVGFKQIEVNHIRYFIWKHRCLKCGETKWDDDPFDTMN